ncbi:hypothetical protein R1sor_009755 [Riccia sorocarpa]|uniref:DDE Tnp4 domain-containing protein n=1 Tax=Riccia sorocarpa TaxID=122646 RepID=A0ABD3HY07_9MARC
MVNYTNRVMTELESAMGHEIAWSDRQERAVNSAHFAELGFPGCIGLVDGTLVKLFQRPRDDGETYFDRKSNYSMNVQVICDQKKRVIYFFAGILGSCHDLTCLRRSSLWRRFGYAQLFDNMQYLLGDNGYMPLDRHVCSYKRTGGDMDKVDFNTCIAHARVGSEHCIGILKTTSVQEFVINWDDRTQSSTIGGREVFITIDTVREYFLLPEGKTAPRSARFFDDLIGCLSGPGPPRLGTRANDVFLPAWRPIIQLVNAVLLGKQKPLEVNGCSCTS